MKEKQRQLLSSYSAQMPNSKYGNEKKKLEFELKNFRDHFNFNRATAFLIEQEN